MDWFFPADDACEIVLTFLSNRSDFLEIVPGRFLVIVLAFVIVAPVLFLNLPIQIKTSL